MSRRMILQKPQLAKWLENYAPSELDSKRQYFELTFESPDPKFWDLRKIEEAASQSRLVSPT